MLYDDDENGTRDRGTKPGLARKAIPALAFGTTTIQLKLSKA